jgi:hypothetical protein
MTMSADRSFHLIFKNHHNNSKHVVTSFDSDTSQRQCRWSGQNQSLRRAFWCIQWNSCRWNERIGIWEQCWRDLLSQVRGWGTISCWLKWCGLCSALRPALCSQS